MTVLLQNLNNNSNKTLWEVYALKPHSQTQSSFSVEIKMYPCAVWDHVPEYLPYSAVPPQKYQQPVTSYRNPQISIFLPIILVFICMIHHGNKENLALPSVSRGIILLSMKFIIQVFAAIHQEDDDGRCTVLLYCTQFMCFATKYDEAIIMSCEPC